jgi:hypothetical protein
MTTHPAWCQLDRCDVFDGERAGQHRGRTRTVDARHGLRVVAYLVQPQDEDRPSVRLVAGQGVALLYVGRAEDLADALRQIALEARS